MDDKGKLTIDRLREGKDTLKLTLSGDLDIKTAPQLKNFIESLITEGDINLKLDLSRLSYLDSSGFTVLVDATRRTKAIKGNLDLSNLPPWMTEFFDMSALER
ncbi:MAG TPA: anti-sigma factor antagonist [Firmicutes bacterium]|nr:anti-sigma factor antagonist [Bacillota bacterium]